MTVHRMLLWSGPEPQRIDTAYVSLETDSLAAHGTSLTSSYALDFRLTTGPGWITRRLDVRTQGDGWWRSLVLGRSDGGHWSADWAGQGGDELPQALPDVHAALDCDLGLCPLTNTMPVLRHDLVGAAQRREPGSHDLLMAWVSVPDLAVHRSEQHYAVSDPVESGGGAMVRYSSERFRTTLEVDADGLVVNYPALGRRLDCW